MPDQFIFLQFAVRYSSKHSMDLPELQINDILRYLGEDDNQEPAPCFQHLMYQLPHLSHLLIRPVILHSTRGWQPPLKDSLILLSYTKTITPTRRGLLRTAVTSGEFVCALTNDNRLPMKFNHNIAGAAKQLSTTIVKVSTELLTSKRSRHVFMLSVGQRLLARTTDRWQGFTEGRTFQNTIHDVKRNKRLARWKLIRSDVVHDSLRSYKNWS
jgi:hypothetical protein